MLKVTNEQKIIVYQMIARFVKNDIDQYNKLVTYAQKLFERKNPLAISLFIELLVISKN